MNALHAPLSLVARIFMAAIFIQAGAGKIPGYAGTQAYMAKSGVPGELLPLVIALEIAGGVAILVGLYARLAGLALALFTIAAAVMFHSEVGDRMQLIHFMKNVAIAGGLLLLAANGPGRIAVNDR
ncbi:MAG: DoxX family protein [Pseudomonadota bacterium]